MGSRVTEDNYPIDQETRSLISKRYKTITKAVNGDFWNSNSETAHSRYVGSYGRGTAINTSDLDVMVELPDDEFDHFSSLSSNGPSRLLQDVKSAIVDTYPRTDVKGDGQVVVVNFSDGMKFEILPAFHDNDWLGNWKGTYKYPDTHMGGNWLSTNPKAEQEAMKDKNDEYHSNGLLFDTCKHIRFIHTDIFSSYHLSGILIDSFVYTAMGNWHWLRDGEQGSSYKPKTYEQVLLDYYNNHTDMLGDATNLIYAPGSNMVVDTDDWSTLGKVLNKMA